MNHYFLVFSLLLIYNLFIISSRRVKCSILGTRLRVGFVYSQSDDFCTICQCKSDGNIDCKRYTNCSELNCKINNKNYLSCCRKLNCTSMYLFKK